MCNLKNRYLELQRGIKINPFFPLSANGDVLTSEENQADGINNSNGAFETQDMTLSKSADNAPQTKHSTGLFFFFIFKKRKQTNNSINYLNLNVIHSVSAIKSLSNFLNQSILAGSSMRQFKNETLPPRIFPTNPLLVKSIDNFSPEIRDKLNHEYNITDFRERNSLNVNKIPGKKKKKPKIDY